VVKRNGDQHWPGLAQSQRSKLMLRAKAQQQREQQYNRTAADLGIRKVARKPRLAP
jgi:hypothetical protein